MLFLYCRTQLLSFYIFEVNHLGHLVCIKTDGCKPCVLTEGWGFLQVLTGFDFSKRVNQETQILSTLPSSRPRNYTMKLFTIWQESPSVKTSGTGSKLNGGKIQICYLNSFLWMGKKDYWVGSLELQLQLMCCCPMRLKALKAGGKWEAWVNLVSCFLLFISLEMTKWNLTWKSSWGKKGVVALE